VASAEKKIFFKGFQEALKEQVLLVLPNIRQG